MMHMHMTLYWGKDVTLLIDSWKTESWLSYLLALLACFIFASFYQYMEDRRLRFSSLASSKSNPSPPSYVPLLPNYRRSAKFATAVLFGINSAFGYILMLAIMSFNGGVFLAIVLGLAVGYLLFRSAGDEKVVAENVCACA
ncbi:copper transporter 5 [Hibiscus trionum]|uniref:Copper transport protein n=1 Tax=Hibiscus trionum TaxID=183268 RepID=A0A9W7J5Z8_HIBTR|nr:copper transporter 5 [Hibiscus trionum]